MNTPRVRLSSRHPGEFLAQTAGRLPEATWAAFRGLVESHAGRTEAGPDGRQGHAFPLAALPDVTIQLRDRGIPTELAPDLVAVLKARSDAAKHAGEAASARIAQIRAELAARGEALRPCQEVGVTFLSENPSAILADDMGLGKTCQGLMAIGSRAVWVTKPSLVGDAVKAVERWRPDLKPTEINQFRWPSANEVVIVTYGQLPKTDPGACPPETDLLADEAKELKGNKSKRSHRFKMVSKRVGQAPGSHRWLLEGTPLMNRLDELWCLLDAVGLAHEVFGTKARFRRMARDNRDDLVNVLRRVILRREKDEVMPELPRTTRTNHVVHLDAETREALDNVLKEICRHAGQVAVDRYLASLGNLNGTCDPARDDEIYLQVAKIRADAQANVQAAIDLAFDRDAAIPFELTSRVKSILAVAKTKASVELLRDLCPSRVVNDDGSEGLDGPPLLFFSEHVRPVEQAFQSIPGAAIITGEVPKAQRTEIVERFQSGLVPLLACTSKTGGEGLTLTRACTGIWNDLPWNYALVNQAEDRMRRPGQEADRVMAIRVVGDHVLDERIQQLITEKQELAQSTVGRTTIAGHADSVARPDGLARALGAALETTPVGAATTTEAPREAASPDERWVAHLFATRPGALRDANAKHLVEAWTASDGKLTHHQWFAATAWAERRAHVGRDGLKRQAVTSAERTTRAMLIDLDARNAWRPHDAALGSELAKGAGNGGLTDGEWTFAEVVVRKYRTGGTA